MARLTKKDLEERLAVCESLLFRSVAFFCANCMYSAQDYEKPMFPLDECRRYFGYIPKWNRVFNSPDDGESGGA